MTPARPCTPVQVELHGGDDAQHVADVDRADTHVTTTSAGSGPGELPAPGDLPEVGHPGAKGDERSSSTGAVPYPARSEDLKGTKDIDGYGTKEEDSGGGGPYRGVTRAPATVRLRENGRFVASDETARFWAKVDMQPDGCWLWTAAVDRDGYGLFKVKRDGRWRTVKAHRWAYEAEVGPTDGLPVDHVRARGCRHRHCVCPDHLEPVSTLENARRARQAQMSPVTATSPPEPVTPALDDVDVNTQVRPKGNLQGCASRQGQETETTADRRVTSNETSTGSRGLERDHRRDLTARSPRRSTRRDTSNETRSVRYLSYNDSVLAPRPATSLNDGIATPDAWTIPGTVPGNTGDRTGSVAPEPGMPTAKPGKARPYPGERPGTALGRSRPATGHTPATRAPGPAVTAVAAGGQGVIVSRRGGEEPARSHHSTTSARKTGGPLETAQGRSERLTASGDDSADHTTTATAHLVESDRRPDEPAPAGPAAPAPPSPASRTTRSVTTRNAAAHDDQSGTHLQVPLRGTYGLSRSARTVTNRYRLRSPGPITAQVFVDRNLTRYPWPVCFREGMDPHQPAVLPPASRRARDLTAAPTTSPHTDNHLECAPAPEGTQPNGARPPLGVDHQSPDARGQVPNPPADGPTIRPGGWAVRGARVAVHTSGDHLCEKAGSTSAETPARAGQRATGDHNRSVPPKVFVRFGLPESGWLEQRAKHRHDCGGTGAATPAPPASNRNPENKERETSS